MIDDYYDDGKTEAYIDALEAQRDELLEALAEVAQALDWQAHGSCRGWSENLLTSYEALELARAAIAKAKENT